MRVTSHIEVETREIVKKTGKIIFKATNYEVETRYILPNQPTLSLNFLTYRNTQAAIKIMEHPSDKV